MTQGWRLTLMLAPAVVVIGGLFGGGLMAGVVRSLQGDAYRQVLASPDFLAAFGLSLYIAVTSTVIACLLAVGSALLLRQTFPGRALAGFLFQLNLTVPHLVGAIGILYLISQSGSFARLARATGLIDRPAEFPALVFDPHAIGIILLYVWKEVPFIGLIVLARMQAIGADYEAVARSLGATPRQAFVHVLLPMLMPAVLAAGAIVFAFTFGAYEIPLVLGESHPPALPVLAWRTYTDVDLSSRPQALAMAVIIALVSAAMIGAVLRLARRGGA